MGHADYAAEKGAIVSIKSIILTLQVFDEPETYSIWKPRDEPRCPYCFPDTTMVFSRFVKNHAPFNERWRCESCGTWEYFFTGDYGEEEIEVTKEEWEADQLINRQQAYLKRRYPDGVPANIHDYWLKA